MLESGIQGHLSQIIAFTEGAIIQLRYRSGDVNLRQALTTIEGIVTD